MPHKIKRTLGEFKRGTLKSGSGATVRKRGQAIAIGLSQDRKAHRGTKLAPKKPPVIKKGTSRRRRK